MIVNIQFGSKITYTIDLLDIRRDSKNNLFYAIVGKTTTGSGSFQPNDIKLREVARHTKEHPNNKVAFEWFNTHYPEYLI